MPSIAIIVEDSSGTHTIRVLESEECYKNLLNIFSVDSLLDKNLIAIRGFLSLTDGETYTLGSTLIGTSIAFATTSRGFNVRFASLKPVSTFIAQRFC